MNKEKTVTDLGLVLPYWMRTRIGRWLASNWHPAAVLWRARMHRALIEAAEIDEVYRRGDLLVALSRAAKCDFQNGNLCQDLLRIAWVNSANTVHRRNEDLCGYPLRVPRELKDWQ